MKEVSSQFRLPLRSPHGPAHWLRVRTNGLALAVETGANQRVVELFALFHDNCRENDHRDRHHGPRGAVLAELMHGQGWFVTPVRPTDEADSSMCSTLGSQGVKLRTHGPTPTLSPSISGLNWAQAVWRDGSTL